MSWDIVENPSYDGMIPKKLGKSLCHDGSPFLTVECPCGEQMHMHESAVLGYDHDTIGSCCRACGNLMMFEPGTFSTAFAEMRRRGWLA